MLRKILGTKVPIEWGEGIYSDWTMQKEEIQTFLKFFYTEAEAIPLPG